MLILTVFLGIVGVVEDIEPYREDALIVTGSFSQSFSFGGFLFIGRGADRAIVDSHEYGHWKQEQLLGWPVYFLTTGIPSMVRTFKVSMLAITPDEYLNGFVEAWATDLGNTGE